MNISFSNFGAAVAFDPLDRLDSVPFLPGRTSMCSMAAIKLVNTISVPALPRKKACLRAGKTPIKGKWSMQD